MHSSLLRSDSNLIGKLLWQVPPYRKSKGKKVQFWSNPSNKFSATWCHLSALLGPSCLRVATLTSFLPSHVSAAGAPAVKDLNEPLVDATICVYSTITSQLLPTPAKSHYTFNLRDLSKVFQGMLMAESSNIEVSPLSSTVVFPRGRTGMLQSKLIFLLKLYFHTVEWIQWCSLWLYCLILAVHRTPQAFLGVLSVRCMAMGSQCHPAKPFIPAGLDRAIGDQMGPCRDRGFALLPAYTNGGFCPFSSPEDLAL